MAGTNTKVNQTLVGTQEMAVPQTGSALRDVFSILRGKEYSLADRREKVRKLQEEEAYKAEQLARQEELDKYAADTASIIDSAQSMTGSNMNIAPLTEPIAPTRNRYLEMITSPGVNNSSALDAINQKKDWAEKESAAAIGGAALKLAGRYADSITPQAGEQVTPITDIKDNIANQEQPSITEQPAAPIIPVATGNESEFGAPTIQQGTDTTDNYDLGLIDAPTQGNQEGLVASDAINSTTGYGRATSGVVDAATGIYRAIENPSGDPTSGITQAARGLGSLTDQMIPDSNIRGTLNPVLDVVNIANSARTGNMSGVVNPVLSKGAEYLGTTVDNGSKYVFDSADSWAGDMAVEAGGNLQSAYAGPVVAAGTIAAGPIGDYLGKSGLLPGMTGDFAGTLAATGLSAAMMTNPYTAMIPLAAKTVQAAIPIAEKTGQQLAEQVPNIASQAGNQISQGASDFIPTVSSAISNFGGDTSGTHPYQTWLWTTPEGKAFREQEAAAAAAKVAAQDAILAKEAAAKTNPWDRWYESSLKDQFDPENMQGYAPTGKKVYVEGYAPQPQEQAASGTWLCTEIAKVVTVTGRERAGLSKLRRYAIKNHRDEAEMYFKNGHRLVSIIGDNAEGYRLLKKPLVDDCVKEVEEGRMEEAYNKYMLLTKNLCEKLQVTLA